LLDKVLPEPSLHTRIDLSIRHQISKIWFLEINDEMKGARLFI